MAQRCLQMGRWATSGRCLQISSRSCHHPESSCLWYQDSWKISALPSRSWRNSFCPLEMRPVAEGELGRPVQCLLIDCRYCYPEFAVVTPRKLSAVDQTSPVSCGLPELGTTRIVPFGWGKASLGIPAAYPSESRHHPGSFPVCVGAFAPLAIQEPPQLRRVGYRPSKCVEG